MGGGKLTKKAKKIFLEEDIEEHRQRTLDKFSTKEYKKAIKEKKNE